MDRRNFLKSVAASTLATLHSLALHAKSSSTPSSLQGSSQGIQPAASISVEGHTLLCRFDRDKGAWTVYEDLRTREGNLTFVSSVGTARVLRKTAEATFADDGPPHLGLDIKDIGMSGPDLLADKLLAKGDPSEDEVRRAAPPMNSSHPATPNPNYRATWNTFVGTRECSDTMPIYPSGNTRTYHPVQYFKELTQERSNNRHEGLVGGWMPAVRKVMPGDNGSHYEVVVFGDVLAKDRFVVQTWHRTSPHRSRQGHQGWVRLQLSCVHPAPRRDPKPEEFYLGMLHFAEYWERQMETVTRITLPDQSWTDMVRYAFAKEQMVRPGGVYPKYGAVDRDYYGSEYDGFQDIFTMALYANLECGRFDQARDIFDNYYTDFTDAKGMINMRGAETAQFGLTLFLIAHYYNLTGDKTLLLKHREKIEAAAVMLAELQDEALALPASDPGHGLIHGWCESDSCLASDPSVWNKPYYANSAFTVRGWREIAATWRTLKFPGAEPMAADWTRRANQLQKILTASIDANTRHDLHPPYVPILPSKLTFREAMEKERPSEQQWSHRCYAELLQPAVIPQAQLNAIIDCTCARTVRNHRRRRRERRETPQPQRTRDSRLHLVRLCQDAPPSQPYRGVHPFPLRAPLSRPLAQEAGR